MKQVGKSLFALLLLCMVSFLLALSLAKTSNDHFAWLFDKIFLAITYAISLCYLMFLVVLRRSKDSTTKHGKISDKTNASFNGEHELAQPNIYLLIFFKRKKIKARN